MSTCSFYCIFYTKNPKTIHRLCMSQFSHKFVLLPHGFVTIKQKHYFKQVCIQREPQSLCSWTTMALNSADSREFPHTKRSSWLHDPSHKFPTVTISVLSANSSAHSFIDPHTITQILLSTVVQQLFPHTVPQTHTLLCTMHVIPSSINSVISP